MSKQKEIYDPIRQCWVVATPEEIVRQAWILRMVRELKFPQELLAVERDLAALYLSEEKLPNRRIDLLAFVKTGERVAPLLLVECKKGELTQAAMNQVIAYNHYVRAPYVAIVNPSGVRFRYHHKGGAYEIGNLPSYPELIGALHG